MWIQGRFTSGSRVQSQSFGGHVEGLGLGFIRGLAVHKGFGVL